jgi:hypothetical protein
MKKLFIMLAAAATVVSCAKEQTIVADQGEAIEFGNVFVDNATRAASATDPSYSTTGNGVALTQFKVYGAVEGVNIYAGNVVTKGDKGYGDAWTVANDPGHRWITGANYKFAAVVDATSVNFDATGMPTSLVYDAVNQKDMLYDEFVHTGLPTNNPRVAFNFTHLLSKVKFSVTNNTAGTADNYQYVVKGIKFTNANLVGEYAVGGTWTVTEDGEYTAIDDLTVASNSTQYATKEVLLIPGLNDADKVGMSFTIQPQIMDSKGVWNNVGTPIVFNKEVVKLVANTAYHFHITVGLNNTIEFTATEMGEWGNGNTTDTNSDNTNDAVVLQ